MSSQYSWRNVLWNNEEGEQVTCSTSTTLVWVTSTLISYLPQPKLCTYPLPHHWREISSHDEKRQIVPAVDDTGTSGLVLRHTQYPKLLSMLAFGVHVVCLNWLSQIWNLADWSCVEQWNYSDKNQKSKNFHSTDSKNDERVSSKDGLAASPVCDLPDPRGLLSFAILAKAITEAISKCRRQLKACWR